jgi:hypothetical protein
MERLEYKNAKDIPRPIFGTYDTELDIEKLNNEAVNLLSSDKIKYTGLKNHNKFCNVSTPTKFFLWEYLNNKLNFFYDWNFEYFQSSEPAGLHTDYLAIPNKWRMEDEEGIISRDCHLVVGVIIPLEWNCKQPYTINYNKTTDIPRKIIYRKGEMRYADNNEIVHYRDKWEYDEKVLKYNPKGTLYHREYADLKVHSVYEWKLKTMMIFDTSRWHSSSWFLSTNDLPESPVEYKRSIIGFGSADVIREEFQK